MEVSVWDSSTTLPAIVAMDPGRVGQHGLEIVLAVCQIFCVHREPVGKRITAAIELADDPAGSPPAPQPTGRTLSQGWSRTRRLLRQRAPSLPPVPRDSASRIREPVGLIPDGPHIQMYRRLDFGRLARLNVLDTRQFRSDQVTSQAAAENPSLTMLGARQKQWLLDGLHHSPARWNLIASQIMMAETDILPGAGKLWYYDAWDGYQAERNALLDDFVSVRNPVVLSGDRHLTMISDLKKDFADPSSDVVGAEIVGTSISSNGDQDQTAFHAQFDPVKADNPHWKVIDAHRGYHLFDIRRRGIDARVRVVETVVSPRATARTLATLHVAADEPGVQVV